MSTETQNYNDAFQGEIVTDRKIPVKAGENVQANQILSLETASQKLIAYNSSDGGAAVVHSIALSAIDATAEDTYGDYIVFSEGFNANALVFENPSDTWPGVAEALRDKGINVILFNKRDALADE